MMKTKQMILAICMAACLFPLSMHAQEYDKLWKEAYELGQEKNLPQSAITKANEMYRKAEARGDSAEMMQAMLYAMCQRGKISSDSLYTDIPRLESWAENPQTPIADAAVMHSVLGEIYSQAAWRGNRQDEIVAKRPEEMDEWTVRMYQERAFEHYMASVEQLEQLAGISYKRYPIIHDGRWSDYYNSDLMHVVARRAVYGLKDLSDELRKGYHQTDWNYPLDHHTFIKTNLPHYTASAYDCPPHIMDIFARMAKVLAENGRQDAWLLWELERINTIPTHLTSEEERYSTLDKLKTDYAHCETAGAVYLEMANLLGREEKRAEQLAIVREGISRYPRYGGINQLRNLEREITLPHFNINAWGTGTYLPGSYAEIKANYRNLDQCTLSLYRIDAAHDSIFLHRNDMKWLKKQSRFISKQHYALDNDQTYCERDTTLKMELPKEYGNYLIYPIAGGEETENPMLLEISSLWMEELILPDQESEMIVLNRQTGHPVAKAEIHVAKQERGEIIPIQTLRTDAEGSIITQTEKESILLRACAGKEDKHMLYKRRWYGNGKVKHTEMVMLNTHLYTDRSIYRPGQTVFVKGIAYSSNRNDFSAQAATGKSYTIELTDSRRNVIKREDVRTNEFGSFSAAFILPAKGLNGLFQIKATPSDKETGTANHASAFIHVEEYKRPTFEVTFDTIRDAYSLGDTITLHGQARNYTQTAVAHSAVDITIYKEHAGYLRYPGDYRTMSYPIKRQTTTDAEGRFSIKIELKAEERQMQCRYWNDLYRINATVTSLTGESREATESIVLSSIPLRLEILLPETGRWKKEGKNNLTLKVTNLKDVPQNIPVNCYLYRQLTEESATEALPEKELVWHETLPANQATDIEAWGNLPSGRYTLVAKALSKNGTDSIERRRTICIHSDNESKVPAGYDDWHHWPQEHFAPGKPARLQWGTTKKDVYVMMDIFSQEKRIESRRFILSDCVRTFTFDYQPEYGEAIMVHILYIHDGKRYSYTHQIEREKPQTASLQVQWSSFRNHLKPNEGEEWTLSITHPDGKAAKAELLAAMYDASLDQFYPHRWNFDVRFGFANPIPYRWINIHQNTNRWSFINFDWIREEVPAIWRYADIEKLFTAIGGFHLMTKNGAFMTRMNAKVQASPLDRQESMTIGAMATSNDAMVLEHEQEAIEEESAGEMAKQTNRQLRDDFNETAFFMPHLYTDKEGKVSIKFKVPESLTSWNFQALAHTCDMMHGSVAETVVTHKEFMVKPYMPRFIRQGDEATITVSITNLTPKTIQGKVRMELFDPMDDKIILSRENSFKVDGEDAEHVSFRFTIDHTQTSLPACRIVAEGGGYSDGEQHYLPILPNKEWMTESVAIEVVRAGKTEIGLRQLFNHQSPSATEPMLTVEFTRNPLWLAIQALPSIATPQNENALSWASAWYAHSMASFMANMHPRIKTMIDYWTSANGEKTSPWNFIDKNNELKNLLIEETPWITEAKEQREQAERLKWLFDASYSHRMRSEYTDKLETLQRADGSWSWFKGMDGNPYVTLTIVEMLEREKAITHQNPEQRINLMLARGHEYLEKWFLNEIKEMRKQKGTTYTTIPSSWVNYLYTIAISGREPGNDMQQSIDELLDELVRPHHLRPISLQAQTAIILFKNGRGQEAESLVKSLIEQTTMTETAGRYFDHAHRYGWRNDLIPTQVKAIEAIETIGGHAQEAQEMKRWLLNQKRTQSWDTPINTVDAVYALLKNGSANFEEVRPVGLSLDNKQLIKEGENGDAEYFKKSYRGEELQTLPQHLTIEKDDEGMVWGAVYAQFLEEAGKVSSTYTGRENTVYGKVLSQPLSIERQLLVERTTGGTSQWEPVQESTLLSVGDKVISRLTIRADRSMDFVQIKESHAACTEPSSSTAGFRSTGRLPLYCSPKDAATLYYIDYLPKGTHIIDTHLYIDRAGCYQMGVTTIQCAYAPEFTGHTQGQTLQVMP